ncbi:translocation protein sec72 [Elsinoe australis]|uniref:Translocation protein sec72 n=1 Tax=Elsinoe australis TaxID=40998 RepID=A0A4U7BE94_9PEZI|nr:translocation protein sec72 [Elsinoe australis]
MESLDTFTQLPLTIDPQTKAVTSHPTSTAITTELDILNSLHRSLLRDLESTTAPHGVPPPPVPVNSKRSAQITKLRETGNASFKKGQFGDAIRMYSLAIDMAAARPVWEPSGLVREELSALYGNRAQAKMAGQDWPGAAADAECSVELKKVGNVKGWWRRGTCLKEMGRLEEAREWVREGREFESVGPDKEGVKELEGLERDIEGGIAKV